jgi:hypothetical protein
MNPPSVLDRCRLLRLAVDVATAGFGVAAGLQVLLAVGVVPVGFAWGGSQPESSVPLRAASAAAAVVLLGCAYVVRRRAGFAGGGRPSRRIRVLAWVAAVGLVLNTAANLASPSAGERLLFGPLTLVLACSSIVVAASRVE